MKRLTLGTRSCCVMAALILFGCGGNKKGDTAGGGGSGSTGGTSGGPGGTTGNADGAVPTTRALRIVSAPAQNAAVGVRTRYRVVASQPGVTYTLKRAPAGAVVDSAGVVTWTPTDTQGGAQQFEVQASLDGETTSQEFKVTAAQSVVQSALSIDPSSAVVSTVTVDSPLSKIKGATVAIDPGSLEPKHPVRVSIAAVDNAPVPPAARISGVPADQLQPVELGPSGTTFRKPVKVQLPVSQEVAKRGKPDVLTFDYETGRWNKVKVLSFDALRGLAIAEVTHFSPYVAVPTAPVFAPVLASGGSKCKDALVVRAPLALSFAQIPASAINGYTGVGATAEDVIAGMTPGQAIQVFTQGTGRAEATGTSGTGYLLASATKMDDGKFRVHVSASAHGGAFITTPSGLAANDPELTAWLGGARTHFIFGALGSLANGASARLVASLYLVAAPDADLPPAEAVNTLGSEETSSPTLSAIDFDDDCDQAPNAFDPTPVGDVPPTLTGLPAGDVQLALGQSRKLSVVSSVATAKLVWSSSNPALGLVAAADGGSATITAKVAGTFHVSAVATAGDAEAGFGWDVQVDPVVVNLPPEVSIAAADFVTRVGQSLVLTGNGKDPEGNGLTYAWQGPGGGQLRPAVGDKVSFSAGSPGDYLVRCTANDGALDSIAASVTITVLSATANRPPDAPSVSPLNTILQHVAGTPVSVSLTALSVDPDGDTVTYDFIPDSATPKAVALMKMGDTATVTTVLDGIFQFYVAAQDARGAISPYTPVKIQILPTVADAPVDNDQDGFPSTSDCNDNDPKVFPGAREICGDGIDQNCDGSDVPKDSCDLDGDHFSVKQGDCNDNNASVNPAVAERCDGVDNNCNGAIDEGFGLQKACRAGVGACQVGGTTICSASFVDVICNGSPGNPQEETCDGKDNDCDGQIDNLPLGTGGTLMSCGGCNIACTAAANTVPACTAGGCSSACALGFVDADRLATNGCECAISNGGVETCDGVDNDCNGVIDEAVTETFYTGPAGTLGVGVCDAGLKVCEGGKLIVKSVPRLPEAERCDGFDNDCNGRVDELFDLQGDFKNCGGCGITCNPGDGCLAGRCQGALDAGVGLDAPIINGNDGGNGSPTTASDGGFVGPPPEMLALCPGQAGVQELCTDLSRDRANCGGCGKLCGPSEVCAGGRCVTGENACGAPKKLCPDPTNPSNAFCTDPMYDPGNCGGCSVRCTNGPCQMGVCGGPTGVPMGDGGMSMCPPDNITCSDPNKGTYCTNPRQDPNNCGACGARCATGVFCDQGNCTGTAPPPVVQGCPPGAPNGCTFPNGPSTCVSFLDDAKNCGACGTVCPAGVPCQLGRCTANLPAGSACPGQLPTQCPGAAGKPYCADLNTDFANCGGCGKSCPAGLRCDKGICQMGTPTTVCSSNFPNSCPLGTGGNACTDFLRDSGNCGGCGFRCETGIYCSAGKCTATSPPTDPIACPPGAPNGCARADGTTACVNVLGDSANCGGCGAVCPSGMPCSNGKCGGSPAPADGGAAPNCPDTASVPCRSATGEMYCADVSMDIANCGGCGRLCPLGARCEAGACTGGGPIACKAPTPNPCDGTKGAYCTDLLNDAGNCGACGIACPQGVLCAQGKCSGTAPPVNNPPPPITCSPGQPNGCVKADGSSYCANVLFDQNNCGKCGAPCPAGISCQMGVCGGNPDPNVDAGPAMGCPATASTSCKGVMPYCADLATDVLNCGACGRGCPAGARCEAGVCSGAPTGACGPSQPNLCQNADRSTYCTDFARDGKNCGACGNQCPAGIYCDVGRCSGTAPPNPPAATCPIYNPNGCPGGMMGGNYCSDLLRDNGNCGRCGNMCPAGTTCDGATCRDTNQAGADAGAGATCPAVLPAQCKSATGETFCADFNTDTANCGGCFKACPYGNRCEKGLCIAPVANCPPEQPNTCQNATGSGTFCTDFNRDPGNCGGCNSMCPNNGACLGGKCSASPTPPATYCPPEAPNACQDPGSTATRCTNLLADNANCGRCGTLCPQGKDCKDGVCGGGSPTACPPSLPAQCTRPTGTGFFCADPMTDAANCGACFHPCPAGARCQQGVCGATGTGPCSGTTANVCQRADGTSFCVDLGNDRANCGGCGVACPSDAVCRDGRCADGAAACSKAPFTSCPGTCTVLSDDPANCGTCGNTCPGAVCQDAKCAPPGRNPFGAPCATNSECTAGSICFDTVRFGWPGGYCTTPCDADRPCAANQFCLVGNGGGGFGTCRLKCSTDADCGRDGYMCNAGLCQPDCRRSPNVCGGGSVCDAAGHCSSAPPAPSCPNGQSVCGDAAAAKQYCTDVLHDQMNCGACGSRCGTGDTCQDGKCRTTGSSLPGLLACMAPGGAPMCVAAYRDNANCGACGNVCPAGTNCDNGRCSTGPMCLPPQTLCPDAPTGKSYCTDVLNDARNCGDCGKPCPGGAICQKGTCVLAPPAACPSGVAQCAGPDGMPYCPDVARDPKNCGGCGIACTSGVCENYLCTGTTPPGGNPPAATCQAPTQLCKDAKGIAYCADWQVDRQNCGGCARACPANYNCVKGGCQPAP